MITRIVRLSFDFQHITTFLQVFEETKEFIRSFDGCQYLELMQDLNHTNVYYTYSRWSSDEALQQYRQSELFESTWSRTKILFNDKPLAYSLKTIEIV